MIVLFPFVESTDWFIVSTCGRILRVDFGGRHAIPARQSTSRIHTLKYWRDFLDRKFQRKLTARGGPITWPPRARDLKPHDFFFWRHIKNAVHISTLYTALPNLPEEREMLRLQLHPPRSQTGLI
jgi:hypothetical protein